MELERIQNEIKIEKDPLEDEHECFEEESKLDQHQLKRIGWRCGKTRSWRKKRWMNGKKVENEIGTIVARRDVEQGTPTHHRKFGNETSHQEGSLKKEVHMHAEIEVTN